jgi:hypothetical protein
MIKVTSDGEEVGQVGIVNGELVFHAATQRGADGLKGTLSKIQKRKGWTNEQLIQNLPKYLTGITQAVEV